MDISDNNRHFDAVLNEEQVAAWLGISTPSLQRMRSSGRGPAFVQLSARRIGYRRSAIEVWLLGRTIYRVGELNSHSTDPKQGSIVTLEEGAA